MQTLDEVLEPIATDFYDLAETLDREAADRSGQESIVIRIEMDFKVVPFHAQVIRHIRDPENLFDRSRDQEVVLSPGAERRLQEQVAKYQNACVNWGDDVESTTLTVYPDRQWSFGSTSRRS